MNIKGFRFVMRVFGFVFAFMLAIVSAVCADTPVDGYGAVPTGHAFNQARSNIVCTQSVQIVITTATTTPIITPNGVIHICGIFLMHSGTGTPTWTLQNGSGSSCASPVAQATIGGNATVTTIWENAGGTIGDLVTPSVYGNYECIVTTGTTISLQGWVTYTYNLY